MSLDEDWVEKIPDARWEKPLWVIIKLGHKPFKIIYELYCYSGHTMYRIDDLPSLGTAKLYAEELSNDPEWPKVFAKKVASFS